MNMTPKELRELAQIARQRANNMLEDMSDNAIFLNDVRHIAEDCIALADAVLDQEATAPMPKDNSIAGMLDELKDAGQSLSIVFVAREWLWHVSAANLRQIPNVHMCTVPPT
ncbi:MAG: hypothetical protein PHR35_22335 [Kiritimatiellae bacterium]|nr:hypothetical protein [Kiritimatiellia bacterium]